MRRLLVSTVIPSTVLALTTLAPTALAAPAAGPAPVTGLAASAQTSTSITLSWAMPAADRGDAVEIREARGTGTPGSPTAGTHVTRVRAPRHSITIPRLSPGARYGFALFTVDAHGRYSRGAAVHALTSPAAVSGLAAFQAGAGIRIAWTLPRTSTFDRVVARYAKGAVAPATPRAGAAVALASGHSRSATLAGLARSTPYAVSVFALDRAGRASTPAITRFTTVADAQHDGTVTGRIVDSAGTPLVGAEVYLYTPASPFDAQPTTTGADGRWSLSAPAGPGGVSVGGDHISGGNSDVGGYLTARRGVNVAAGRTIDLGDSVLKAGAAVTGTITDAAGHGTSGVGVFVDTVSTYVQSDSGGIFLTSGGTRENVTTAADGSYTITGVAPGATARICATRQGDDRATECTRPHIIGAANTSTAVGSLISNSAKGSAGVVTGHVRGTHAHGLAGVLVTLSSNRTAAYAFSATGGGFVLTGVAAGTYQVCAEPFNLTEGSPTGYVQNCAGPVTVTGGRSSAQDVSLGVGAALSGTVTGPSSHPVAADDVEADPATDDGTDDGTDGSDGSDTVTDAAGHYLIVGLAPGSVVVCAAGLSRTEHGLPTGTRTQCSSPLALRAGLVRAGGDLRAKAGAAISGRVLDSSGAPVAGADVEAFLDTEDGDFGDGGGATSDATGHYTIVGLDPGPYGVCAFVGPAEPEQGTGVQSCPDGDVRAVAGRTATANRTVPLSATVHLTIRDGNGDPVAGVNATALAVCPDDGSNDELDCSPVKLFDPDLSVSVAGTAVTDASGTATLHVLAAGRYAVCGFAYYATTKAGGSPTGYADRCTGPGSTVTLTGGQSADVELDLVAGGAVSGRVTDTTGRPLRGAQPYATNSAATDYPGAGQDGSVSIGGALFAGDGTDTPGTDSITGPDGTFTLLGVQPGKSAVCVLPDGATGGSSHAGYLSQCVGGQAGGSTGSPVSITSGTVTHIDDVQLSPAAGISGTVRTAKGTPLADAQVLVIGAKSGRVVQQVSTGSSGTWRATQLAPASYYVCFGDFVGVDHSGDPVVVAQCWRNVAWSNAAESAPPLGRSTVVVARADDVTTGIDGRLDVKG